MITLKVNIEVSLSEEFLSDILIIAFDGQYGGCWYWAQAAYPAEGERKWLVTNGETDIMKQRWLSARIEDFGKQWVVDHKVLADGIRRLLDGTVKVNDEIVGAVMRAVREGDAGEIDSEAADCIVQAGVFDELIYG